MELPIGILIFLFKKLSDEKASLVSVWYYKEIYLPGTPQEKKECLIDFKNRRCTALTIKGSFQQICDLIMLSDKFNTGSTTQINQFANLVDELSNLNEKPYIFDDVQALKGTSLALDIIIDIEEDVNDIISRLNAANVAIEVTLSPNWSFQDNIIRSMSGY